MVGQSAMRPALRLAIVAVATVAALAGVPLVLTQAVDVGPPTSYATCVDLHGDYPHGVGAVAAVDGLVQRRLPAMDDRAYEANARLDTDRDGIACERR